MCAHRASPHTCGPPSPIAPPSQAQCRRPDIIQKLILESYVPGPTEFVSGVIKTNDIPGLIEFSRVFNLNDFQA